MTPTGLLLVGHGTRSVAGTKCVEAVHNLVSERLPEAIVRYCFLELHDQTVQRGISELIEQGISQAVVAPLLLFSAGHAKSDIPRETRSAAAGKIELNQADALGCHPAVIELSHQRYLEAIGNLPPVAAEESCLLLVGRGSHDPQATAEMHRFADLRRRQLPGQTVEVAFIAMAAPTVNEAVGRLANQGFRRIVVQPHLLFPGELLDGLASIVACRQMADVSADWRLTPPLAGDLGQGGPADRLLVDAVVERAEVAMGLLSAV